MHTFFINTSGKEFDHYADLFEIQRETRKLIALDCPLVEWENGEKGYQACVNHMGEQIDSYQDINNDFNLIVYIDLQAYGLYADLAMDQRVERYACRSVLETLLRQYVENTLVASLHAEGRAPQETLLIFEKNGFPEDDVGSTTVGKDLEYTYFRQFLGLPAEKEINEIVFGDSAENMTPAQFAQQVGTRATSPIGASLPGCYTTELEVFLKDTKGQKTVEIPLRQMMDRILSGQYRLLPKAHTVSFATNRRAGVSNKREIARRDLRLAFYIMSCTKDESIFVQSQGVQNGEMVLKQFPEISWEEVGKALKKRRCAFLHKHREARNFSQNVARTDQEIGLVPELVMLHHEKFGLDGNGERAVQTDSVETQVALETQLAEGEAPVVALTKGVKSILRPQSAQVQLADGEYSTFKHTGKEQVEITVAPGAAVGEYERAALHLRQKHLDYLRRLDKHVSNRLSHYAGRSQEQKAAILTKRNVNLMTDDLQDDQRRYRYARKERPQEQDALDTARATAQRAYATTLLGYMEFCAARSVAVTDIEQQCDDFITRVHQIKQSLDRILLVSLGLLFAVLALYIPFVVLQWSAITENALTMMTALGSIGVPVGVLCLVTGLAALKQRQKCQKAWEELQKQSRDVMNENIQAVDAYEKLLNTYIPALRYVYEYKLDVEFYEECCQMAQAKVEHHTWKLWQRAETIGNIIEDLEMPMEEDEYFLSLRQDPGDDPEKIEYHVAFCANESNRERYEILNAHVLKAAKM